jgi:hypothetical protein
MMLKRFEDKRWGLAISIVVLVSLVLLTSALKDMSFRPARPLVGSETEQIQFGTITRVIMETVEIPLWKHMVFWGGVFLIVVLISTLLSPEMRKRLIAAFLRMAVFVLALLYIIKNNPGLLASLFPQFNNSNDPSRGSQAGDLAPPVFQPPHISNILSYIIAFIFLLFLSLLLWRLIRWWTGVMGLSKAHKPLTEIAEIVRSSLKGLASGEDSTNVIIRCYERMSIVLDAKRGLHRQHAMTPSEFAAHLAKAGLPREPVSRLTLLFENARYGERQTGPREVDEAVSCLTLILEYCGESL